MTKILPVYVYSLLEEPYLSGKHSSNIHILYFHSGTSFYSVHVGVRYTNADRISTIPLLSFVPFHCRLSSFYYPVLRLYGFISLPQWNPLLYPTAVWRRRLSIASFEGLLNPEWSHINLTRKGILLRRRRTATAAEKDSSNWLTFIYTWEVIEGWPSVFFFTDTESVIKAKEYYEKKNN